MDPHSKKFFWIDMEMTGLDEKKDVILEVACVVTDLNFALLEEYNATVFQPPSALSQMDDWCKKTHGESGLTLEVAKGKALGDVEKDLIGIINRQFLPNEKIVLAGNSVGNDRRFVDKYMPEFAKHLHYRLIDVSSFKEVFREKYGITVDKKDTHRARADIFESIEELKRYLSLVKTP